MQNPLTATPSRVCPVAGGLHVYWGALGGVGVYEQAPLAQVPCIWSHAGGLMQSAFVQHSLVAMHPLLQIFCPVGQVQPPVVHSSPAPQAGEPLHVQVPLLQVLVVALAQSLLVQHSPDGMHEPLHTFCPDGQAQPAPVQTMPETHGMSPLQVHVPALHVLVDDAVQSPLVQHSDDGMQLEPHFS
jgi:hypothetical protein